MSTVDQLHLTMNNDSHAGSLKLLERKILKAIRQDVSAFHIAIMQI